MADGTRVKRVPESEFDRINTVIFDVESLFPIGHPVRRELYLARITVAHAASNNRANKDWPQHQWEYEEDA